MFLIKKKILSLFMIGLLLVMCMPQKSYANVSKLTKETILSLEKDKLLDCLRDEGLVLPQYSENHKEVAEKFVSYFTPLILNGKIDTSVRVFNLQDSNEMLKNLEAILIKKGLINRTRIKTFATNKYKLKDSTPIGSWSNSYEYYNCYAYSIGRTMWRQPNGIEDGGYGGYDCTRPISVIADEVLNDLNNLGYWGYKTTTKPTSRPDNYFRVICVRKNSYGFDYHFMKMQGSSLNSWTHKPGDSQPLKWKYSSPGAKVWTNEAIDNYGTHEPKLKYDSEIYYILYKGKNDPGIKPNSHMEHK